LSQKTGLFNLRLSSDAPNLQVENEETIEALSARTEALLEGIQQRFSFARSIRTRSCRSIRFSRFDDRPLCGSRACHGAPAGAPRPCLRCLAQKHTAVQLAGVGFSPSVFISFSWFSRAWTGARIRSFSGDRCAFACRVAPFSKIIVSAVSAGRSVGNDNALSRVKPLEISNDNEAMGT
jgi:hypothetical protein